MKEFKEGFHRFLVGITLMSGAMYISTWAHYLVEKVIPFFFEIEVYEPFPWIF